MRKSCLFCVSKHISQAIVLTIESVLGYPIHLWLAVGHLDEEGNKESEENRINGILVNPESNKDENYLPVM